MKKILGITLVLSVLGFAAGISPSDASSKNEAAAFLTKVGIRHYHQGQYEDAAHELSKALMLDPENEQAKAVLREIGIDQPLYTGTVTAESQLVDLARDVKKYQAQIASLAMEKMVLEKKFNELLLEKDTLTQISIAKDLEQELLQAKLEEVVRVYDAQGELQDQKLQKVEALYEDQLEAIEQSDRYQSGLALQRQLMAQGRNLTEREKDLDMVNQRFIAAVKKLMDYEDRLKDIDDKYFDLKYKITQRRAIDTDMMALFEENIDQQREQIDDLKDQMVFDAIELGRKKAMVDRQIRK